MIASIQTIKYTRGYVLNLIEDLSIEQLNKIPEGFSNNIAWNIGHLIAAQQGVCYKRSGLPLSKVDEALFETYKPGSKPERFIDAAEIAAIKTMLYTSLDKLQEDYDADVFKAYIPWTTRYGNEISDINVGIGFITFHEGLHTGFIMALKKLV